MQFKLYHSTLYFYISDMNYSPEKQKGTNKTTKQIFSYTNTLTENNKIKDILFKNENQIHYHSDLYQVMLK